MLMISAKVKKKKNWNGKGSREQRSQKDLHEKLTFKEVLEGNEEGAVAIP